MPEVNASGKLTRMHPEQVKIYQQMSMAKKLSLAGSFMLSARKLKAHMLKMQHPDWSDTRIKAEVRRIFLYASH